MKKYQSVKDTTNEFADYTPAQILKLIDSVAANSLERKDLIDIVRELAYRNKTLENDLSKF